MAILVSTNQRGRQVADALTGAGVPVAFSGADSIFATPAAKAWLVLLRALEQPRRAAVRAAILTDFVGGDLTGLATADEEQLTAWSGLLQGWSRVLAGQGVAALFAAVQAEAGSGGGSLAERVLRRPRGERDLTDYRHLAEILHAQHTDGLRGQALVSWLRGIGGARVGRLRPHPAAGDRPARRPDHDRAQGQGPPVPGGAAAGGRRPVGARRRRRQVPRLPRRRAPGARPRRHATPPAAPSGCGRTPPSRRRTGCAACTSRSPAPSRS